MSQGGDERRYIRAVEAAWSKHLGRQALVSPREFETIDGWRRRGIPLTVVLEVIADAGKRRSGRGPQAITALAKGVSEAWEVVAAGRTAQNVTHARPTPSDARRAWEEALDRFPEPGGLRTLLTGLLAEEAQGAAPEAVDASLDDSLAGAVPEAVLAEATAETARALVEFRSRMSEEEFRKTFARALVDRLRRALALPRLALTRRAASPAAPSSITVTFGPAFFRRDNTLTRSRVDRSGRGGAHRRRGVRRSAPRA